jgi:hypothetical protein
MAVLDKEGMGPQFGPDGLKILLQASGGKERIAQVQEPRSGPSTCKIYSHQ